jgi:predicted HicB family RNase H-like nuclease
LFEGESCALSYNDEDDWFHDEDEQFVFNGSNKWFEDAFQARMKECEDMRRGYLHAVQRQLDEAVKSLGTAVNKSLDAENIEKKEN